MSDPEVSAASTERRGRGHHCWPSRSRASARRTESAAGVIGETSPVASIPSHRAITRMPPSGDGPRPDARRTEGSDKRTGHRRGGEHHPQVAGHLGPHDLEATRGHPPFVLGPADALCRPRVGADAEQPGPLVDAHQGHPTTGERDRGAQPVAAAFRDEIEELGLLVADAASDSSAPPGSNSASSEADDRRSSRTGCLNGPPPARTLAIIGPSPGTVSRTHHRTTHPIGSRGARLRVPLPVLWTDLRGAPTDRGCDLGRHLPLGPRATRCASCRCSRRPGREPHRRHAGGGCCGGACGCGR